MMDPPKDVTKDDINCRIDMFVKEVSAAARHKDFSPGTSWWVWNRNGQSKHPNATPFEKQLGLTNEQMKVGMGRTWRRSILKAPGEKIQIWPGGMDGMEWITVSPTTGEPGAPGDDTIVTNGADVDSLRKAVVDDTSGLPDTTNVQPLEPLEPAQPSAEEAAAAAKKKRRENVVRKYQTEKSMTTDDMDVLLKLIKAGKLQPNEMMKKVMHSVVGCTKDKDGIATSYVPRMISPRNGAKIYMEVKVAILPKPVTTDSSRPAFNKSTAKLARIMDELFGDKASKIEALKKLADTVGVGVVDRRQQLSKSEALACRRFARVSSKL